MQRLTKPPRVTTDTIYTLGRDPKTVRTVNRFISAARKLLEEGLNKGGRLPRELDGVVEPKDGSYHIRIPRDPTAVEEFAGAYYQTPLPQRTHRKRGTKTCPGSIRKRAIELVTVQMEGGKGVDEICRDFKLSEREGRLLTECILKGTATAVVASELGIKEKTVRLALKRLLNKLECKDPYHERKERYRSMTVKALREAFRNAATRSNSYLQDWVLGQVARERGIQNEARPNNGKIAKRIARMAALVRRLPEDLFDSFVSQLNELDQKIINEAVLAEHPKSLVSITGLTGDRLCEALNKLEKKLSGSYHSTKRLQTLKRILWFMESPRLEEFRGSLDEKEYAVVNLRVLKLDPLSQMDLASLFSVTNARICQIESELLKKALEFSGTEPS